MSVDSFLAVSASGKQEKKNVDVVDSAAEAIISNIPRPFAQGQLDCQDLVEKGSEPRPLGTSYVGPGPGGDNDILDKKKRAKKIAPKVEGLAAGVEDEDEHQHVPAVDVNVNAASAFFVALLGSCLSALLVGFLPNVRIFSGRPNMRTI